MTKIDVNDVSFTYKSADNPAIANVSVSVDKGEFLGITGPAEAGKTTFCRLLPSFIPNFFGGDLEGSVTVAGKNAPNSGIGALGEKVGYVFENPFDQLTGSATSVLEEAAFGLEQRNIPREELEPHVRVALSDVGIEHLADRDPYSLSGGQLQRVAIASVLAFDPEILVLDEPTSQLDPDGTEDVFKVASDLKNNGYTVVFVSQDLQVLAPRADRLLVFEEGRIIRSGSPHEVLSDCDLNDIVRIPTTARIGRKLREKNVVPADRPLPLTVEETVQEIQRFAADISTMTDDNRDKIDTEYEECRVVIDGVGHVYDGAIRALQDVSFALDEGCVVLLGHNGAGKTTLAKHLNGLIEPTEGRVMIRNTDTRDTSVSELARDVGLVFQDPDDQLFRSSVADEVRFGPENLNLDDITDRVDRVLEQLFLTEVRNTNTYELGRAIRKRIALASVLAMDTPILILDEPTGEQDANGVRIVGDVIRELVAEDRLVICITHDVEFAREHADRIVALSQGEVIADGAPRDVFGNCDAMNETGLQAPVTTRVGRALGIDDLLEIEELVSKIE